MKFREMKLQSHINTLWTILKMWGQLQATPIPPYSNGFYQLVSGCTQRVFFSEGVIFIGPSLIYLSGYLASVTFFLPINLSTYMLTYSSNLSILHFDFISTY